MTTRVPIGWSVAWSRSHTAEQFFPITHGMSARKFRLIRATFEIANREGDPIQACLGYQTAQVESSADAYVKIGSLQNANGVYYSSARTDISANTDAKELIRFGWVTKNTVGDSLQLVRLCAVVEGFES